MSWVQEVVVAGADKGVRVAAKVADHLTPSSVEAPAMDVDEGPVEDLGVPARDGPVEVVLVRVG